jgi:hypothetical protein
LEHGGQPTLSCLFQFLIDRLPRFRATVIVVRHISNAAYLERLGWTRFLDLSLGRGN